ncbi:MAG: NAD-dependent epimerase/dehydratase family protein [bacterium]|nr:NAD-dependent epimerase/dehydratase family protein [bacterium]
MKIFLTGADGLLGSNLVRMLLDQGHEVTVFIHPSSKSKSLDGLDIEVIKGDILKPEFLKGTLDSFDAIIHAAAITDVWPSRSEFTRRVNIEGTKNILQLAIDANIKRFIYISTASAIMENHGAHYGLDYIDSKFEAQKIVQEAGISGKIETICVLPTFMIGPYDSKPSSGKMILTLALGKLKFYSGGGKNFVYVKDVAQAAINALTMGESGKAYVAGGQNMEYKPFFETVAGIVHQKPPKIKVPYWLILTIGKLSSLIADITNKPPLLTYPMARISLILQYADSTETVKELKMPQTDIKIAIKECYDWFKSNNYC